MRCTLSSDNAPRLFLSKLIPVYVISLTGPAIARTPCLKNGRQRYAQGWVVSNANRLHFSDVPA